MISTNISEITIEYENNQIKHTFENRSSRTQPRFTRSRRNFTVTYSGLSTTELNGMFQEYDNIKTAGVTTFVDPISEKVYSVRFAEPITYTVTAGSLIVRNIQVKLQEA